jgi:hypothetical protein
MAAALPYTADPAAICEKAAWERLIAAQVSPQRPVASWVGGDNDLTTAWKAVLAQVSDGAHPAIGEQLSVVLDDAVHPLGLTADVLVADTAQRVLTNLRPAPGTQLELGGTTAGRARPIPRPPRAALAVPAPQPVAEVAEVPLPIPATHQVVQQTHRRLLTGMHRRHPRTRPARAAHASTVPPTCLAIDLR